MAGKVTNFGNRKATKATLDAKLVAWARRKSSLGVDWSQVSASSLRAALHSVIEAGGLLMIGGAMGGQGVMLQVLLGDERKKEYAATHEEVNELLELLIDALASSSEDVREGMKGGAV